MADAPDTLISITPHVTRDGGDMLRVTVHGAAWIDIPSNAAPAMVVSALRKLADAAEKGYAHTAHEEVERRARLNQREPIPLAVTLHG